MKKTNNIAHGILLPKSKAQKGISKADVANTSVRNVLTEISKKGKFNQINDKNMIKTEVFFNWKCPYTGRNLKNELINGDHSNVNLDHIVPINKKHCGLNICGNLVWVDKNANELKKDLSVEEFFNIYNGKMCGNYKIEKRRLRKIKQWQKKNNYDPEKIQKIISKEMIKIYNKTQKIQDKFTKSIISKI